MSDLVGQKLGPYEITSLIGRGGMATVYLAQQTSMNRIVAVKVLPPQLLHDQTFIQRFRREVQAISRLQHPRIIPVYDYGEDHETPYIVMAYIEGGSLADRIKDKGGGLPLDETLRLIGQIAEGLDYAHHMGVIHRDFKPSNVLLDAHGNAYLSDFGIAKVSQETAQLTGSTIIGTPTYMAPEMFKLVEATPLVDIYALGVTLYQMLSGDAPYGGTTPVQLMYAHLNEPIPLISAARPDIPEQIQAVIDRAMAKNPAARYPTAEALAEELALAARGELTGADGGTQPLVLPRPDTAASTPTEPLGERPSPAPHGGADTPGPEPTDRVQVVAPPGKVNERFEDRKDREKPRRKKGGPWLLWLVIGLAIFFGLCKGASLIAGAVGAAVSSGVDPSQMDGTPTAGTIEQPLQDATTLEASVSMGAGSLHIDGSDDPTVAATGSYSGHGNIALDQTYQVTGGKGVLTISPKSPGSDHSGVLDTFRLSLNKTTPLDLTVSAGAGETDLDLTGMLLTALRVKGGVGKFTIQLPASGTYTVDVASGVGETDLLIPSGVEAHLDVTGGFSNIDVADGRFKAGQNNVWETEGYQSASQRVRISITAGVGKVLVDRP